MSGEHECHDEGAQVPMGSANHGGESVTASIGSQGQIHDIVKPGDAPFSGAGETRAGTQSGTGCKSVPPCSLLRFHCLLAMVIAQKLCREESGAVWSGLRPAVRAEDPEAEADA